MNTMNTENYQIPLLIVDKLITEVFDIHNNLIMDELKCELKNFKQDNVTNVKIKKYFILVTLKKQMTPDFNNSLFNNPLFNTLRIKINYINEDGKISMKKSEQNDPTVIIYTITKTTDSKKINLVNANIYISSSNSYSIVLADLHGNKKMSETKIEHKLGPKGIVYEHFDLNTETPLHYVIKPNNNNNRLLNVKIPLQKKDNDKSAGFENLLSE